MLGQHLRLVHHAGDVQQRLRRNAADVEAHAAERRVALDQHRLHAEIGGAERGAVAARSGAEHEHPAFDVGLAGVGRGAGDRRGRWLGRCAPLARRRRWPAALPRRRGLRGAGCGGFEHDDERAFAHLVAELDLDFLDGAGGGRGNVHRRLVRFERDERILGLHRVARLHEDLDDRDVLEVADVGDFDLDGAHGRLPRRGVSYGAHSITRRMSASSAARYAVKRAARRAVDHAMVVGERQRHHQARRERLAVPHRLGGALRHAEDRDFRRVDDRRERRAADAAQARDREAAALHVGRAELAFARLRGERRHLRGDREHALLVGVLDHRHDEAVRRVGGEADVEVLLQDQVVAVERGIDVRELPQRGDARLDQEREHRHLDAGLLVLLVERDAEGLEVGDVRLVELRDVRNHHPVAGEVRAGDLLDPRQRPRFDRTELREVDGRPRQQVERAAAADAAASDPARRRARAHRLLHEILHVLLQDAALRSRARDAREIDAQLARELAHRRRRVRGLERGGVDRSGGGRRLRRRGRGWRGGGAAAAGRRVGGRRRRRGGGSAARLGGARIGAAAPVSSTTIAEPSLTLSPSFTFTSLHGAGGTATARPSSPCPIRA